MPSNVFTQAHTTEFVVQCFQRYNAIMQPVAQHVCELVPEHFGGSTAACMMMDDLDKLPSVELSRVCEWLREKVDCLSCWVKNKADCLSCKAAAEPSWDEEEVGAHINSGGCVKFWAIRQCRVVIVRHTCHSLTKVCRCYSS